MYFLSIFVYILNFSFYHIFEIFSIVITDFIGIQSEIILHYLKIFLDKEYTL